MKYVHGGFSQKGKVASNSVIISGGTINGDLLCGAYSPNGTLSRNLVKIIGGNINSDIRGGFSEEGNVDRNSVVISGGTFDPDKSICAGYIQDANNSMISNNTVNLTDIVTGLDEADIYGYFYKISNGDHSGNELHIGGTKTYDSEGNPVVTSSNVWQGKSSDGTVNNTIKKVANFETIALHNVSWNKDLASLKVSNLNQIDTLDITNIKFNKNDKEKTDFAVGDSMNLLEWSNDNGDITNLKYKSEDTGNEQTSLFQDDSIPIKSVDVSVTDKGITLDGTGKCNILKTNKTVKFTVNKIILNSVDLSNWNGQESTITSNWNGGTNVSVVTGSFQHPTNVAPGSTITILTNDDTAFKNNNITGSRVFGNNLDDTSLAQDFTDDTDKGITFAGKYEKGVKASDDNKSLIYAVETTKYIKNIDLGTINSTNIRNMENTDYDFSKVSTIDATNLKIDNHEDLNKGDTVNLLTNAKNLEAGKTITGASHSQERSVKDNNSGINFEGELIGNVSTIAENIQYKLNDIKLNKIDLSDWNGTTLNGNFNYWTSKENTTIETDGLSAAVINGLNLNPGDSFDIISETSDNNFFDGMEIKGGLAWQSPGDMQDRAANGVIMTGHTTGGGVKASDDGKTLTYYPVDKEIEKFNLADWDGENYADVSTVLKIAYGASLETDGMINLPESDYENQIFILKSDQDNFFANVTLKGENLYGKKQYSFTESDEAESVVICGVQEKGVTFDSAKKNIVYKFGSKDVTSSKLNTIAWKEGAELLSRDAYNYSKLTSIDTKDFNITYEKPEMVAANQTMTLLKANGTLSDMAALEKSVAYQYEPLSGVTMDAVIRSSLETKSGNVALTAVSNKADKLTFGNVDWLENGALIDHKTMLNNVSFDGAEVDTYRIAFMNKDNLDKDMEMTLVSNFDGNPGPITGSKYKVGTAYEGEGYAYMNGNDLVFKTKTTAGLSDRTHIPSMGMVAGIVMIAANSEYIGNAIDGLGDDSYVDSDEMSAYFMLRGNSSRYETGSHVDINSLNCTLAIGNNEKKDGPLKYGLFAEYGRGNYSLHMEGIDDAGSGNINYTGGGLFLKLTNKYGFYTEASLRRGSMIDKASNLLQDGAGNSYGYDVKTKYRGGHFGIGKTYKEDNNTKLEIYGKYFYNQREGINFAAGADQYKLDDVRSRVLRAGFRLSSTDKKWNRYGGISYDYEFGGKANGSVNGNQIRAASIKGGTLRGEFGYCREATKTNPWKTDVSLYGFTGKRQGFGGNIAFEYHF